MLFLWTLDEVTPDFGLVTAETGDPFAVRGTTGYAARERGTRLGWNLSVVLPDGQAIYAIVTGLELDQVVTVLDGLTPRPDTTWEAGPLPVGMVEVEVSQVSPAPHCYSAVGDLPDDEAGEFEVNLYQDPFDQRLADRAASTQGLVEEAEVDGIPASIGSYRADDHWVMLEPEPGRTIEIRASSMTREQVLDIVAAARFVDEATWQQMSAGR